MMSSRDGQCNETIGYEKKTVWKAEMGSTEAFVSGNTASPVSD